MRTARKTKRKMTTTNNENEIDMDRMKFAIGVNDLLYVSYYMYLLTSNQKLELFADACKTNHLGMVKLLFKNIDHLFIDDRLRDAIVDTAAWGHLNMLRYLHSLLDLNKTFPLVDVKLLHNHDNCDYCNKCQCHVNMKTNELFNAACSNGKDEAAIWLYRLYWPSTSTSATPCPASIILKEKFRSEPYWTKMFLHDMRLSIAVKTAIII